MKCLMTYPWVKLPRAHIPSGKGVMGSFLRLAARAAYRPGEARYCGYINQVDAGSWAGGIVGIKSILGIRDRKAALAELDQLQALGYISYSLDAKTKKLTYTITDWVKACSGEACEDGAVYTTEGYGFLCIPRNITDRLVAKGHIFAHADAWLDLWCHTVYGDKYNAFSRLAPVVQLQRGAAVLTLDKLGERWGWEKTKVWRFLHRYADVFRLHKLPGSYGCLIFNQLYPAGHFAAPTDASIKRILDEIRFLGRKTYFDGSDHDRINQMTLWFSSRINLGNLNEGCPSQFHPAVDRVALLAPYITRAYFSLSRVYDCHRKYGAILSTGHSPPQYENQGGIPNERARTDQYQHHVHAIPCLC